MIIFQKIYNVGFESRKKKPTTTKCVYYIHHLAIFFYLLAEIVELYAYRVHIAKKGGLACLEYKRQPGRR